MILFGVAAVGGVGVGVGVHHPSIPDVDLVSR